jgi:hypothetical protein
MDLSARVAYWAGLAAAILVALHLVRAGLYGARAIRAGYPSTMVGVALTTSVIGIGVALGASWLGGTAAFYVLSPLRVTPLLLVIVQLVAAFALSWAVSMAYGKWGAPAVAAWFSGEGTHEHG